MFEEIRVSTFFKASQGQITEADLKGLGRACLWEMGVWPCGYLLETSVTYQLNFFPQGYVDATSSHFQLTSYLFGYFSLILVELRNFSNGFQE